MRQVLIEARIVEASDTFGKSLGVRLGGSDLRRRRNGDAGYAPMRTNRHCAGGTYDAVAPPRHGRQLRHDRQHDFVNLPAAGLGGFSPSTFAISLFSSSAQPAS